MNTQTGTVKWFDANRGYGFLLNEHGDDVFVHHRDIRPSAEGYKTLRDGEQVEFKENQSQKGLKATEVWPIAEIEIGDGDADE